MPPQEHARALAGRLAQPALRPRCRRLVEHRAHPRLLVERVAGSERGHLAQEELREAVRDVFVNVHALHGGAHLTGEEEAPEGTALRGELQVGVRVDDDRAVAAELERDLLPAGTGTKRPSDLARAGEGEAADSRVGDERIGHVGLAGEHADQPRREVELGSGLDDERLRR